MPVRVGEGGDRSQVAGRQRGRLDGVWRKLGLCEHVVFFLPSRWRFRRQDPLYSGVSGLSTQNIVVGEKSQVEEYQDHRVVGGWFGGGFWGVSRDLRGTTGCGGVALGGWEGHFAGVSITSSVKFSVFVSLSFN